MLVVLLPSPTFVSPFTIKPFCTTTTTTSSRLRPWRKRVELETRDVKSASSLLMAKKAVGGGGNKKVQKSKTKRGGSNYGGAGGRGGGGKPGGRTKTTNSKKKDGSSSTKKKAAGGGSGGSSSVVTPPWQVVSKKDMVKNIQTEQKRREQAQQHGIHLTPEEIELQKESYRISSSFLDPADKSFLAWKRFTNFAATSITTSSTSSGSPSTTYPSKSNKNQDEIRFIGAYLDKRLPPRMGVPEIAFLGRSNVGKSSLLNKLVGGTKDSNIARVGKTPGATASVNLYTLYRKSKPILGLVDLPGFGYAKLSKENKESVQLTAENYLEKRKELVLGILLVDIRRTEPSDDDKAVLAALYDMGIPIVVVATKADKLSTESKVDMALESIRMELGLPEGQPLCVSSVTGQGIKDLWKIAMEACETGVEEYKNSLERGGGEATEGGEDDDEQSIAGSGNYIDDDDEIAYSQGYDWIHGSYDDDVYDDNDEEYDDDDEDFDEEDDFDDDPQDLDEFGPKQKESIKFLRRKARDMERRGEV